MSAETILTAARRLVRFVRIDNEQHGGLVSRETIVAADTLDREVKREERREAGQQGEER